MLLHKSVVRDSRVRREAATLADAGHDVTVLELVALGPDEERLDGFRRHSALPSPWTQRFLPFSTYRAVFLANFVAHGRALRPEVIHAHDAAMLLPGALLARLTGAHLVYDSHELATGVEYRSGAWARLVHVLEATLVRRCAAVITVSDGIADRLQARYALRARPVVLRNVCGLPAPDGKRRLRARLGLGSADPLVLHQGSAAPGRCCDVLIRAVAAMPGVHLALLGAADDPNAGELIALTRSLHVDDRVHVLHSVALADLLAHTADADVGVSLLSDSCENHRLALPNKVFEYLAAGVPVVTSALPELERIVLGRSVGWTVDPADPADVRRGLELALAARGDSALRARVATAAAELSWPVERSRLLDLYERLEAPAARVRSARGANEAAERRSRSWVAPNVGAKRRAALLERVLELTDPQRARGDAVLDIGCGRGWWLTQLTRAGVPAARLHGIDLIPGRVERARRAVPGARIEVGDATALPFPDARFGVVLLMATLSSAGDDTRVRSILGEARRVLAPGGALIVYEPRLPNGRDAQIRSIGRDTLVARTDDEVRQDAIRPAGGGRGRPLTALRASRSHYLTSLRAGP